MTERDFQKFVVVKAEDAKTPHSIRTRDNSDKVLIREKLMKSIKSLYYSLYLGKDEDDDDE